MMIGRYTQNKRQRFAGLLLMFLLLWTAKASAGPIAVLLSDEEEAYSMPINTFIKEIGNPVELYNLQGDIKNAPEIMDEIISKKPDLIFALGAKAAYTSKVWTTDRQEIPVIFAMVLNWQRYNLLDGQDNIAGIAYDVAPGTQFVNMTMFSPNAKRIGVIYSEEHSEQMVLKAQKAAQLLGIELVSKSINHPKEFRRAFREISNKIDSYWILTDPVVYTLDNLSWLRNKCIKNKLICIGQSKNVAKLGTLLAVDPDIPNIGSQAASMARNILLKNQDPNDIGVMPPLGTRLYVNLKTARKIGITVSQPAMDMVNEIVDK